MVAGPYDIIPISSEPDCSVSNVETFFVAGTRWLPQVYVSCNPTKSLAADATILCTPVSKSTTGLPFRPVKVCCATSGCAVQYCCVAIRYGMMPLNSWCCLHAVLDMVRAMLCLQCGETRHDAESVRTLRAGGAHRLVCIP